MKNFKKFLTTVRALHKSGKLDDATSQQLRITTSQLWHCLQIGDRRGADKHFETLCRVLSEVLV